METTSAALSLGTEASRVARTHHGDSLADLERGVYAALAAVQHETLTAQGVLEEGVLARLIVALQSAARQDGVSPSEVARRMATLLEFRRVVNGMVWLDFPLVPVI